MRVPVTATEVVAGDQIYLDETCVTVLSVDDSSGSVHPEGRVIRFVLPTGLVIVRGWWETIYVER